MAEPGLGAVARALFSRLVQLSAVTGEMHSRVLL